MKKTRYLALSHSLINPIQKYCCLILLLLFFAYRRPLANKNANFKEISKTLQMIT